MKFLILILSCVSAAIAIGYEWRTPEGCNCACPATYRGPIPPPSANAAAVTDPYNRWNTAAAVNPYHHWGTGSAWGAGNSWGSQNTWPGHQPAWNSRWNASAWNDPWRNNVSPWNKNWQNRPAVAGSAWNRGPWNNAHPGYAGIPDLRTGVAAAEADSASSSTNNGIPNTVARDGNNGDSNSGSGSGDGSSAGGSNGSGNSGGSGFGSSSSSGTSGSSSGFHGYGSQALPVVYYDPFSYVPKAPEVFIRVNAERDGGTYDWTTNFPGLNQTAFQTQAAY